MDVLKDGIKPLFFRCFAAATGSALVSSIYCIADASMIGRYHGPSGTAALTVFSPIWSAGYGLGLPGIKSERKTYCENPGHIDLDFHFKRCNFNELKYPKSLYMYTLYIHNGLFIHEEGGLSRKL